MNGITRSEKFHDMCEVCAYHAGNECHGDCKHCPNDDKKSKNCRCCMEAEPDEIIVCKYFVERKDTVMDKTHSTSEINGYDPYEVDHSEYIKRILMNTLYGMKIPYRQNASEKTSSTHSQDGPETAKFDAGKPKLSLVPINQLWRAIAAVREYGCQKYHDPENWRNVEVQRYYDAFLRHVAAMANNPYALDEESGLPHIYHAACNLAFILELDEKFGKKEENK